MLSNFSADRAGRAANFKAEIVPGTIGRRLDLDAARFPLAGQTRVAQLQRASAPVRGRKVVGKLVTLMPAFAAVGGP